jgi:hypothetical protein
VERLAAFRSPVRAKIIHDHDVAGLQVGAKAFSTSSAESVVRHESAEPTDRVAPGDHSAGNLPDASDAS